LQGKDRDVHSKGFWELIVQTETMIVVLQELERGATGSHTGLCPGRDRRESGDGNVWSRRGGSCRYSNHVHRSSASAANGRFVEADESGHHVHKDRPQRVIKEIRAMLDRIRAESPRD
jgi:hypothetical protein